MKKILVIEDDCTLRLTIKELLETNNYEVFSASNGIEGIQLAKDTIPDLIVCDVMMPNLDGYKVLESLKKEPLLFSTPFIFLTAKAEPSDIRNGMENGADDYLTKPFRAINLLKAIETRLERFSAILKQKDDSEIKSKEPMKELLTENDRLFIDDKNKPHIIRVGDILWIKADGEYSIVCTIDNTKLFVRKLIKQWELQLPQNIFMRIHRSSIVNITYMEKIEMWTNRSFILLLKHTNEKFIVSQRYTQKIKSKLVL